MLQLVNNIVIDERVTIFCVISTIILELSTKAALQMLYSSFLISLYKPTITTADSGNSLNPVGKAHRQSLCKRKLLTGL